MARCSQTVSFHSVGPQSRSILTARNLLQDSVACSLQDSHVTYHFLRNPWLQEVLLCCFRCAAVNCSIRLVVLTSCYYLTGHQRSFLHRALLWQRRDLYVAKAVDIYLLHRVSVGFTPYGPFLKTFFWNFSPITPSLQEELSSGLKCRSFFSMRRLCRTQSFSPATSKCSLRRRTEDALY